MKVDIYETGVGWTKKLTLLVDCRDENRTMGSGTADVDHSTTDKGRTRATTSVNCWLGRQAVEEMAPSQEALLGDLDGTLGGIT